MSSFHGDERTGEKNTKGPSGEPNDPLAEFLSGDVLLSHAVARAVPSALRGLASGFGMGPGVSLSLWSPKRYGDRVRTAAETQRGPYLGNRTVDASADQGSAGVCGKSSAY